MEIIKPHVYWFFHFVSRKPREVSTYLSIVRPFLPPVWAGIAVTLFCLHIMFYISHLLYSSKHMAHEKLHVGKRSFVNFGVSVYFKVTEPEAMDMFSHKWSTGRLLSFLWAVFCFFVITFYNSNLRAHLAAITYQDPIETSQNVVDNGQKVWIMKEMDGNL